MSEWKSSFTFQNVFCLFLFLILLGNREAHTSFTTLGREGKMRRQGEVHPPPVPRGQADAGI